MAKNKKSKGSNTVSTVLIVLIILLGVGLLLYPTISNIWNEKHMSGMIAGYTDAVAELSEADYSRYWEEARAYNESLVGQSDEDRFYFSEKEQTEYDALLNVANNSIMAYVEVPSIKVKLPIYHGTSDAVLQVAIGHVEGSSLPIGGSGTHVALSGHRGLPSAKLFTQLDKVKVGDKFYIHVLGETLTYQVDQIEVVLPEDMSLMAIEEGKDYCTLVTCTPYGVNSHRLLVRGARIETVTEIDEETGEEVVVEEKPDLMFYLQDTDTLAALAACVILVILLVTLLLRKRQRKKKPKILKEGGEPHSADKIL